MSIIVKNISPFYLVFSLQIEILCFYFAWGNENYDFSFASNLHSREYLISIHYDKCYQIDYVRSGVRVVGKFKENIVCRRILKKIITEARILRDIFSRTFRMNVISAKWKSIKYDAIAHSEILQKGSNDDNFLLLIKVMYSFPFRFLRMRHFNMIQFQTYGIFIVFEK